MKPEVHWYLVEQLANARADVNPKTNFGFRQHVLIGFSGVLTGFRYLNEITEEEQQDWSKRMLVALRYEVPEPGPPGTATAIYVGDPATRSKPPTESPIPPRFIRSVPCPDQEFDVHGGKLRIIAIEIYDSRTNI